MISWLRIGVVTQAINASDSAILFMSSPPVESKTETVLKDKFTKTGFVHRQLRRAATETDDIQLSPYRKTLFSVPQLISSTGTTSNKLFVRVPK
jgi:hypothetical protein